MRRLILATLFLAACNESPAPVAAATPPAIAPVIVPVAAPVAAVSTKLGAPITEPIVALSDIAKSPARFKGKAIATTGTVKAVCQERGCWMEITDATTDANVRMHGHAFFIPKSSSGKKARVQGTVMLMKDGKECEEMASTGAQLQMDATGVELVD
ncbi:MAG: DUF4920 domain-containing protein [Polyangiaceae bacterium]